MERIEKCKLCGMNLEAPGQEDFDRDIYTLKCPRCREYEIAWDACQEIQDHSPFLQAAARQAFESGSRVRITRKNWEQLIAERSSTGVPEKMEKLLTYISRKWAI